MLDNMKQKVGESLKSYFIHFKAEMITLWNGLLGKILAWREAIKRYPCSFHQLLDLIYNEIQVEDILEIESDRSKYI